MKLENKYATDLTNKDKNIALCAAKHIINNKDMDAWKCFVENSDNIFDFIKQNIAKYFSQVIDENNYMNLFEFFKIHSFDWDECFIQILLRFSYHNDELTDKMLDLIQNGSEDEKAYAAKFFSFAPNEKANGFLYQSYSVNYEPLKYNAAKALGDACDMYSYNYYMNKLNAVDDWEKVDAAQFLQWYGNKKAYAPLLDAMVESAMPEHIAGSVAMLENISNYFNSDDTKIKDLSLFCYQHLIDSLAEIWPLATLFDFNIYDCAETLITLINENSSPDYIPRYCALLLKTKNQLETFYNNDEYKFNEDKNTLEIMENILELLNEGSELFWNYCKTALKEELLQSDNQRVLYALEIISTNELKNYIPQLKTMLYSTTSEEVLLKIILTLDTFKDFDDIDKNNILSKIQDENIKVMIENIILP